MAFPIDNPIEKHQQNDGEVGQTSNQLATQRVISSIPRYHQELNQTTPSQCPINHQSNSQSVINEEQQNWVYPSPSQFYQALKRKNRNPKPEDMYTVVPIHNAVNERVWTRVLEWEAQYGRGSFDRWPRSGKSGPMLCSFRGRPNDLTPRAWIKVMSGYQAPFDRHDWEVIRPTERRMRYVVDFYAGRGSDYNNNNNQTNQEGNLNQSGLAVVPNLAFYLDVRPALDSWEGLRMRFLCSTDRFLKSFKSIFFQPSSSSSSSSTSDPTRPASTQDSLKKS